jgi:hypothetical protein
MMIAVIAMLICPILVGTLYGLARNALKRQQAEQERNIEKYIQGFWRDRRPRIPQPKPLNFHAVQDAVWERENDF